MLRSGALSGTDVGFVGLSIDRRREERDSDDDCDDAVRVKVKNVRVKIYQRIRTRE